MRDTITMDAAANAQRKIDARQIRGSCVDCIKSSMTQQLGQTQLICRAHPPRLVPLPMPPSPANPAGGVQFTSLFPPVESSGYCHEHEAVEVANS
jgi:hypothetical protein